jgi:hypothetical protein
MAEIRTRFLAGLRECVRPTWQPSVDVYQGEHGWLVKCELAGVRPEDVQIAVADRRLTISGVRRDWSIVEGHRAYSIEICYDRFERVLDEDHYDLTDVKARIIEHLAVLKLNPQAKSPILCFVGPPGVGKTSLGKSIARSLGRRFERMSLGGLHDDCRSIPIAHQIKRIYERDLESCFFPGNAEHGQSFVHLDDLVDCLDRVVDGRRDLGAYEVFLVGKPDVMSYAELQDRIGEARHRHEWPTIRIPKTAAKAGAWLHEKLSGDNEEPFIKPWMVDLADAHYPVNPSKVRERLGWPPGHSLRTTLGEMLRRLKENPRRWYEVNKLPVPEQLTR